MRLMHRLLVTSTPSAALAGGSQAAEYALEREVGALDGLGGQAARALLVRYAEGAILTYAPMQARVAASAEGGPTRARAELLTESAKSGR